MSTTTLFSSSPLTLTLKNPNPKPKPFSSRSLSLLSPLPLPNLKHSPLSLRPSIKHLACTPLNSLPNNHQSPLLQTLTKPFSSPPLSQLTPLSICKWTLILSLALTLAKTTVSTLLSPFFWTYLSFTWVFWPYIATISLTAYSLYCLWKHSRREATIFQQLLIVSTTIAWLTIVPAAHFNGFIEGWPIAIFFVYHYFFFFESTVRRRMYGDLYWRDHDPKWEARLSKPVQIAFSGLVLIAHFLAAYEGPELHLISGSLAVNLATWVLVLFLMFMRYNSVLYLAKYSERMVVPTAVVQFGPYRWVRHPIYASIMLLFSLYCLTLQAPLSLGLMVAVCIWYYGKKAELEEALMVETFGEWYKAYMAKVRYRFIPLLY